MMGDLFDDDAAKFFAREMRNPLRREMEKACQRLELRQMEVLRGLGIPAAALLADCRIGVVHAEIDRIDYWQPEESGKRMLVTPLFDGERITDLIAFEPNDPDVWYLRTGAGFALGADAISDAVEGWNADDRTLVLHNTPLAWLQHNCEGVCVTHWTDEARQALRLVEKITVSVPKAAQILRLELTRPPRIPEIDVKRMRSRAA